MQMWCEQNLLGELRGADPNVAKTPNWQTSFVRGRDNIKTPLGGGAAAAAAAAVAAGAGAAPSRTGRHLGGSLQQQDAAL